MQSNRSLHRTLFLGCLSVGLISLLRILPNAFSQTPDSQAKKTSATSQPVDSVTQIPIGPDTWRLVQVDVDNVYQDQAVLKLRNKLMMNYAKSMAETDQMPLWADRETARNKARQTLTEGIAQLRDMAEKAKSPLVKQEASLAIMEIQYTLGDNKALAEARETVPSLLTTEQLRLQADWYLIEGARRQPDTKAAATLFLNLSAATPSLNQFYDVTTLRGCLRQVVTFYEFAQGWDDLALQEPKKAALLRQTQESLIVQCNKLLDAFAPSVPREKTSFAQATTKNATLSATTAILSGNVLRSDGVTAVPKVLVMFSGATHKVEASALTDKDGRFAGIELVPGSYSAAVFENNKVTSVKPFVIAKPTDNLSLTIQYSTASLHGVVKTPTGAPIENANVTMISDSVVYDLTTDKNGTYQVEPIVPGKYMVIVTVPGQKAWVEKDMKITDQQDQTKDFQQSDASSK